MAENNRNLSIFLLVLALIGAALFYGCGSATSDNIPDIEYSITGTYSSAGLSDNTNASARAALMPGLSAGILIYSESDPTNYAEIDKDKKRFAIRNLKPGKHYVVFRHKDNFGKNYIVRSSKPVELTSEVPIKELNEQLIAVKGTIAVTGKLTNSNGQIITPTPTLTLWGQEVEVNPLTGEYTTPEMPEGTTADLIVNAINYKQTSTPIVFESNPAYYEFPAVETTINNVPPTVTLSSKRAEYNIKSAVTLTAVAKDSDNDELDKFEWHIESCTSPKVDDTTLEKIEEYQKGSEIISIYYWNAPDEDCVATISVTVREKNTYPKLSAKSKLKIKIGDGNYRQNTIPTILNATFYPETLYGNRTYTVTCIATDTDGDALTYFLNIVPVTSSASVTLSKSGLNTWTWRTASESKEISYSLNFEVRDPKGNVASRSFPVSVRAGLANNPPVINTQNPQKGQIVEVMSGNEQVLVLTASDPENEKLSFAWNSKMGTLKSTSVNNNTASATWIAPYLNNATQTTITCTVYDPYRDFDVTTFTINIKPDPNKKAPEISIMAVASSSPNVNTTSGIPLLKATESITFTGSAMDLNKGIAIDPSRYKWEILGPGDSTYNVLNTASNTAIYPVTTSSPVGDYVVKMTALDLTGISGEATTEFRVNAIPLADILCNGNEIVDGRMSTPTIHKYKNGNTFIDVYNYSTSEKITLTASCTDIETDSSTLKENSYWTHNGLLHPTTPEFSCPLTATGTNVVNLTVADSKEEHSATSTYSFFVNTAPIIEVATSTEKGFVNTDIIDLKAKVVDDVASVSVTWYVSYFASGSADFTNYELLSNILPTTADNKPFTSVTSKDDSNVIDVTLKAKASTLLGDDPEHQRLDFRMKLIASDSMGLETTAIASIAFSIISPHHIATFTVASGAYYDNKEPFSFDELTVLLPSTDPDYKDKVCVFEANQPFSIKSGSDKWESAMTWTWKDTLWTNGNPGETTTISSNYIDPAMGCILNGYTISDKFGTHTILLEGTSIDYGVVATYSIDIFVNSTPKVEFRNVSSNTMRFDTNSNATFTITLKEDDPNEVIGLDWEIYNLNNKCEEEGDPITYTSHGITPSSEKSPVYMAGVKEKAVTVNWSDFSSDPLSKGAKRVTVYAKDQYGKVASASVDILVNTLPTFKDKVTFDDNPERNRKILITVEDNPTDSGENYEFFKEQYATTTTKLPVYLVAGNPSMQLKFNVEAYDPDDPDYFDDGNHAENKIFWKYTNEKGQEMTLNGDEIRGRFAIGLNTVNVECRDEFYNYYKKGDEYVYNDMCIATTSEQFYLWQSMEYEMDDKKENAYTANALYATSNNHFHVSFGKNDGGDLATYTTYWELHTGVNTDCFKVEQAYTYPKMEVFAGTPESGKMNYTSVEPKIYISPAPAGIITILQKSENDFLMLTNSVASLTDLDSELYPEDDHIGTYTKYRDTLTDKEYYDYGVVPYTAIKIESRDDSSDESMASNEAYGKFSSRYPFGDSESPKTILSMTYCDSSDGTAGAMLLHNYNGNDDALAAYMNARLWFLDENNSHPLYAVDGKKLELTENSKLRYLTKIDGLSQRLFFTDTNNDRIIRCSSAFSDATSIVASKPIDICTTTSKYLFSLSEREVSAGDTAITLYDVNDTSATPLTTFAKFVSDTDPNKDDPNYRAGKVMNPKSIIYYVSQEGNNYYGGLIILEQGIGTNKNRIQVIRSNLADWLE